VPHRSGLKQNGCDPGPNPAEKTEEKSDRRGRAYLGCRALICGLRRGRTSQTVRLFGSRPAGRCRIQLAPLRQPPSAFGGGGGGGGGGPTQKGWRPERLKNGMTRGSGAVDRQAHWAIGHLRLNSESWHQNNAGPVSAMRQVGTNTYRGDRGGCGAAAWVEVTARWALRAYHKTIHVVGPQLTSTKKYKKCHALYHVRGYMGSIIKRATAVAVHVDPEADGARVNPCA